MKRILKKDYRSSKRGEEVQVIKSGNMYVSHLGIMDAKKYIENFFLSPIEEGQVLNYIENKRKECKIQEFFNSIKNLKKEDEIEALEFIEMYVNNNYYRKSLEDKKAKWYPAKYEKEGVNIIELPNLIGYLEFC